MKKFMDLVFQLEEKAIEKNQHSFDVNVSPAMEMKDIENLLDKEGFTFYRISKNHLSIEVRD